MKDIKRLVNQFRDAIELAQHAGEFNGDLPFCIFPRGCCGDASDLLAHFLLGYGIKTYYVCGTYRDGSFEKTLTHAWLLTGNQTIIDITGDQFRDDPTFLNYDKSAYVGAKDNFHKLFVVEDGDVHEANSLDDLDSMSQSRLKGLYRKIIKFL